MYVQIMRELPHNITGAIMANFDKRIHLFTQKKFCCIIFARINIYSVIVLTIQTLFWNRIQYHNKQPPVNVLEIYFNLKLLKIGYSFSYFM